MNKSLKDKWSALRTFNWSAFRDFSQSRYRLIRNRYFLKKDDVQVASFPRSGNTWLRFLLADMFLQMNGFQTSTAVPIHLIIPDLYENDIQETDSRLKLPFRMVKTHENYDRRTLRTIYLFRQAEDALCSYFHFHERYRHLQNGAVAALDRFCIDHLGQWCQNVQSFIKGKEENENRIFIVSYETLHRRPEDALVAMMRYLGLEADQAMAHQAVENHRFEKHSERERARNQLLQPFYRKGRTDSAKEELQADTLSFIKEKAGPFYDKAVGFEAI